ncbi:MAG: AI-2E family transporter [Lachnospiraceae bacterium]|nr:AI-2E family transporter [Lachnospiraceae bacterium]
MSDEKFGKIAFWRHLVLAGAALIVFFFAILRYTGLLAGVSALNRILMPVYLGVAMAFLLNPIMSFFEKRISKVWKASADNKKIKAFVRVVCTILALAILLGLCTGFMMAVVPQFLETAQYLIDHIDEKIIGVIDWADELTKYRYADVMENARTDGRIYVWLDTAEEWAREYLKLTTQDEIMATATRYGMSAGKLIVNFIIGIFIAIYLLISKELYKGYTKRFVYGLFHTEFANAVIRIIRKGNEIFYGFIIGKLIDSLIIGVICYISMLIMNMPYPILCSFIIGVTNIIPIFGPYIGALPTVILIFVTNPPQGIIFLIYIIVLQQVDGNLIGPKILGDSTGVSSFWVIIAIVVGGGLFGFIGMLLGVPTLALLLYIGEEVMVYRTKKKGLPTDPETYIKLDHVVQGTHEVVMHSEESSYSKALRNMRNSRISGFGKKKEKSKEQETEKDSDLSQK